MHPTLFYQMHRLEQHQRQSELRLRSQILQAKRRKQFARFNSGGRSTGRLFAARAAITEFVRAS